MELWIIFSLIGAISLSIASILSKRVISSYGSDPIGYLILVTLIQQILVISILPFYAISILKIDTLWVLLALSNGVILFLYYSLFFKLLTKTDVYLAVSLSYLYPFFILIGQVIVLGYSINFQETINQKYLLGCIILVISALLITFDPLRTKSLSIGNFSYLLFIWISIAATIILSKYILSGSNMDYNELVFLSSCGSSLGALTLIARKRYRDHISMLIKESYLFIILILIPLMDLAGKSLRIFALGDSNQPYLVASIYASQPLIIYIYLISDLLVKKRPLPERVVLVKNSLAVSLIVIGI